jgi:hypothetical protein
MGNTTTSTFALPPGPRRRFTVSDSQHRHLQQQALLHDGRSISQLASHVDVTRAAIRRAITDARGGVRF